MATNARRSKGSRLGTQFRGKLAAEYGHRGVGQDDLWYVYSPRMRSDCVLRSDLEWDHFVLAESDPDIVDCVYRPDTRTATVGDDTIDLKIDALVTLRDGTIEARRIRSARKMQSPADTVQLDRQAAAAKSLGLRYQLWTDETIRRNQVLLANWRRVVAWLAAARDRSLSAFDIELAAAFAADQQFRLSDIEARFGEASFPLYAAAAFAGLQRGTYGADLDTLPLSPHTLIRMMESR